MTKHTHRPLHERESIAIALARALFARWLEHVVGVWRAAAAVMVT